MNLYNDRFARKKISNALIFIYYFIPIFFSTTYSKKLIKIHVLQL